MGNKPVRREQALDLFHDQQQDINENKQLEDHQKQEDLSPDMEITHRQLSNLFQLGLDCLFDDPGGPACGRTYKVQTYKDSFGGNVVRVGLNVIKSTGEGFIKDNKDFSIMEYQGTLRLRDLPLRPIRKEEKEALKVRGREFVTYGIGFHFLETNAKMFVRGKLGNTLISAEGRVVVDISSFNHFNSNYGVFSTQMENEYNQDYYEEMSYFLQQYQAKLTAPPAKHQIVFREDAFEKLVLSTKLKDIVKGLAEQQSKNRFTDILGGKGGGVVFLLHGVPGVGKTLTAEAVAEYLHKPLYIVDVGELGVTPAVLEKNLRDILDLAERWNSALLIDEADIFLQKRTTRDVLRNAMVGIFLHLLEYHNGVLFLTSNRLEEIDEAFRSRISVALHYRKFDKNERIQVWSNLLDAAEFKLEDISAIEKFNLNGRQIKTAIRLAISLAKYLEKEVTMEHIVHTTLLIQEFHENLGKLIHRK